MFKYSLTIITPTYNRGNLLWKCFESLSKQTNKDFQWIVVDDGSRDETKSIVESMISLHGGFDMEYVFKKNGGKHTAMNASHKYIKGKYVLILDSDDILTEDAVETVLKAWNEYEDNKIIGTLIFLRGDGNNQARAYGKNEKIIGDYRQLELVEVSSSDCCEVFRSELFKQYPYTEFEGEKFLSESELWNRLAEAGYKVVYINKIVYICEYLEGGLTDSGRKMRVKSPLGGMCTSKYFFHKAYPLKLRIKKGLLYICYGHFAGMNSYEIFTYDKQYKVIKLICMLPGYFMYLVWKKKYQE